MPRLPRTDGAASEAFFPRQLVRGSGGEAVGYLGINGGVNEP